MSSDLFIETYGQRRPRSSDRLMLELCLVSAWRGLPERFHQFIQRERNQTHHALLSEGGIAATPLLWRSRQ